MRRNLLTRAGAAKALGVSPAALSKMVERGAPVAGHAQTGRKDALYDVEAIRSWRSARAAARDNGAREERDLWQARLARQLHATRARRLLDAAEVEQEWSAVLGALRARLLALPSAWSAKVATATSPDEVRRILDAAVREALAELSRPEEVA